MSSFWRAASLIVTALTLVGAPAASATIAWTPSTPPGPALWAAADDGSGARVVAPHVGWFELSPDGTRAAFARGDGIWVRSTDPGATAAWRMLRGRIDRGVDHVRYSPTAEGRAAWSPDGSALAVVDPKRVLVVNRNGSVVRRIGMAKGWIATGVTYAPSGDRVAITRQSEDEVRRPQLLTVTVAVGRPDRRSTRSLAGPSGFGPHAFAPLWTAAGIVVVVGFADAGWSSQGEDDLGTYLLPSAGGAPVAIGRGGAPVGTAGGRVALSSGCVWDLAAGACATASDLVVAALAPDGTRVVVRGVADGTMRVTPIGTGGAPAVLPIGAGVGGLQWR